MPEEPVQANGHVFEAVVVGSGFAGAVTACRLAQAGFDVCILERGRRYEARDFPAYPVEQRARHGDEERGYEPPGDLARWLWPVDQGIWDVKDLGGATAVMAAGYGGGSLVYASVHLRAPPEVFDNELWPECFRRTELNEYYDLVAYMLDVRPFPQTTRVLAKTQRLSEAGDGSWFLPPLAVNFKAGENQFGVEQGACDLRGYCCLGCGATAKNTLDLNYLTLAENPDSDKGKAATALTLAELKWIRCEEREGQRIFVLEYRDHLQQRNRTIESKYVFLCAGAVNTTELLLRNASTLFAEAESGEGIGSSYFPNADSFAAVFDCDEAQQVDVGPTITSSIVYDVPTPEGENNWFLVQDGGVPRELDAVLGLFRSPLWLRRNRYREGEADEGQDAAGQRVRRAPRGRLSNGPSTRQSHAKYGAFRRRRPGSARDVLAILPPNSASNVRGTQGLRYPDWLGDALPMIREQMLDYLSIAAEPVAQYVMDDLALLLEPRLVELAQSTGNERFAGRIEQAKRQGVARGLVRLGAQLLWGSESDAVRHVLRLLLQLPGSFDDASQRAISFLRWGADYAPGDGRTSLLLTMGRDRVPGRLTLANSRENDRESGELVADLKEEEQQSLRSAQERALRDIAKSWGGELRTNPAWTFGHRRLTVHSQGGCPMEASPDAGDRQHAEVTEKTAPPTPASRPVTRASGELRGCPGLYVMDASAFPTAVGVNPAPTIAAIAEKKIEGFIREKGEDAGWVAPQLDQARKWANGRQAILDPLAKIPPKTSIDSEPIGIVFKEAMVGHFSADSPAAAGPGTQVFGLSDVATLSAVSVSNNLTEGRPMPSEDYAAWTRRLEIAEIRGIRGMRATGGTARPGFPDHGEIRLECGARIEDLAGFLEKHHACQVPGLDHEPDPPTLDLTGKVFVADEECEIRDGSLGLFHTKGDMREKNFLYQAGFEYRREPYWLRGVKVIRDDARFDVWSDTATLYTSIFAGDSDEPGWSGIMRLPAAQFLTEQIRSFEITGTDDEHRRVWALAAFVLFFFGHLAESYLPEIKLVPEIMKNMITRTHG